MRFISWVLLYQWLAHLNEKHFQLPSCTDQLTSATLTALLLVKRNQNLVTLKRLPLVQSCMGFFEFKNSLFGWNVARAFSRARSVDLIFLSIFARKTGVVKPPALFLRKGHVLLT